MGLPFRKIKNSNTFLRISFCVVFSTLAFGFFSLFFSGLVSALIREEMSYSGKVTDSDGTNLTTSDASCIVAGSSNDTCDFRFRIYDNSSGGNLLWEEIQSDIEIGEYDGIFQVQLGSVTSLNDIDLANFNRDDLWIEVEFDPSGNGDFSEGEVFSPRKALSGVAYAFNTKYLDGIDSGGFVQYGPGSAQGSGEVTSALIWLNENGTGTPNLMELEVGGVDRFVITNGGDMMLGGGDILGVNGIGIDIGEENISGVTFTGDIFPGVNNTYDVGSLLLRWRDGYFSGVVNIGDGLIISDNGILDGNGSLNLQSNNDTDNYIKIETLSDDPTMYWEGVLAYVNDPGIRVNSVTGKMEYRDEDEGVWTALDSLGEGGPYVSLHPDTADLSGDTTNPLIWINENGTGTPNLIQLERGGLEIFSITNDSMLNLGQGDSTNNAVINLYGSNGESGRIIYNENDEFSIEGGGLVFNSERGNYAFNVRGTSDDGLIYADTWNNRVGIGTSTPNEKLSVDGNMEISGDILPMTDSSLNNPDYEWTRTFGGTTGSEGGRAVAVGSDGSVYTTGDFQGTNVDFDAISGTDLKSSNGGQDVFITKYNSDGSYGWTRTIGASGNDQGMSLAVGSDGSIYVTGSFVGTVDFDGTSGTDLKSSNGSYNIFITKYHSDGSYGWARVVNTAGNSGIGQGISVNGNDQVFVTGYFLGTDVDFDDTSGTDLKSSSSVYPDIFITRYNSDGSYGWTRTFGGSSADYGNGISTSGNAVYITGYFQGTNVDFDATSGTDLKSSNGGQDSFITRYNSDGSYGWTRTFGGSSSAEMGMAVGAGENDSVYASGYFADSDVDFDGTSGVDLKSSMGSTLFLTKYNADGSYCWTRVFGGLSTNRVYSVKADTSARAVYLTGFFPETLEGSDFDATSGTDIKFSQGGFDIFITKYNSDGSYGWTRTFGGVGTDAGYGVSLDRNKNIYLTGQFTRTEVDFNFTSGTDFKTSNGDYNPNIFVTKLSADSENKYIDMSVGYDGTERSIQSVVEYNGRIYIGEGGSGGTGGIKMCDPTGGGDIRRCDHGSDWITVYSPGGATEVLDLEVFNGYLYAGTGGGSGGLHVCQPGTGGDPLLCDSSSDWSLVYSGGGTVNGIRSILSFKDRMYIGLSGTTAGDGDVVMCNPAGGGDGNVCDNGGDFSMSWNGSQESVESLATEGNRVYAGQGTGGGDSDIYECNPAISGVSTVCESGDWGASPVYNGSLNRVAGMSWYRGKLYAGIEGTTGGDGDIVVWDGVNTTTSPWATSFSGDFTGVRVLGVYEDKLYAGTYNSVEGSGAGQLLVYNGKSWRYEYYTGEEEVRSVHVKENVMYIGQGGVTAGDGDLLIGEGTEGSNSIGRSDRRFLNIYTRGIDIEGTTRLGGVVWLGGDILPENIAIEGGGTNHILESTNNVGQWSSVAINNVGRPVIAYRDVTNSDVRVMVCGDEMCTGNTAAPNVITSYATANNTGNMRSSVLIRSNNLPLISFYDATQNGGDLRVIDCTNATCSAGTLRNLDGTASNNSGQYNKMVLRPSGLPLVFYYDVTNTAVRTVACTAADCSTVGTITTIDNAADVGQYISAVMRPNGLGYVSYYDNTTGDLKGYNCTNDACTTGTATTLVSTNNVGQWTDMTLSREGFPLISYVDVTNGAIRMVECLDMSCNSFRDKLIEDSGSALGAPVGGGAPGGTSIGTTKDGRSVISYYDNTNGDLRMYECSNEECSSGKTKTVVSTNDVGGYQSMVRIPGDSDRFLISHYDVTGGDLNGYFYTPGSGGSGVSIGNTSQYLENIYTSNIYSKSTSINNFDIAEEYEVEDMSIEAGDVVRFKKSSTNKLVIEKTGEAYDRGVIGVISTEPGVYLKGWGEENKENGRPVGLVGRVPVKVNLEGGEIEKGDYITASSVAGVGMKAGEGGMIIGRAMEGYRGNIGDSSLVREEIEKSIGEAEKITEELVENGEMSEGEKEEAMDTLSEIAKGEKSGSASGRIMMYIDLGYVGDDGYELEGMDREKMKEVIGVIEMIKEGKGVRMNVSELEISGGLRVEGDLEVMGRILGKELKVEKLSIGVGEGKARGVVVMKEGESEIKVENSMVTPDSLVLISYEGYYDNY
ncbi:hypothetical protein JW796_00005, partial [Candidatus Dojkabacteria bacterium]|nr:hypothetical protein [Candidatus Dojkabacteria bacterium]